MTARELAQVLRDAAARVVRVREALEDGDTPFAALIVGDLEDDLHTAIAAAEQDGEA